MSLAEFVVGHSGGLAALLCFHSLLLTGCFWLWLEYREYRQ